MPLPFRMYSKFMPDPRPWGAGYYTTNFSATENPISEGGRWTCGGTVGLDWTNPQTTPGIAFGTQTPKSPPPYDDSVACLSGFAANHYCTGVIHNASASGQIEVELLLRWAMSANSARGYEIDITQGVIALARWNGPLNDYTVLANGVAFSKADGAVWYAQIVGHVITVKVDGTTSFTYDTTSDSPRWDDGNPGLGFYRDTNSGVPSAANTFGWSSYTASNL